MPAFTTQVLTIEGMHCDACVRRVTQALGSLPGVRLESVTIGEAHVLAEPPCEQEMREAIEEAGFTLKSIHGEA